MKQKIAQKTWSPFGFGQRLHDMGPALEHG